MVCTISLWVTTEAQKAVILEWEWIQKHLLPERFIKAAASVWGLVSLQNNEAENTAPSSFVHCENLAAGQILMRCRGQSKSKRPETEAYPAPLSGLWSALSSKIRDLFFSNEPFPPYFFVQPAHTAADARSSAGTRKALQGCKWCRGWCGRTHLSLHIVFKESSRDCWCIYK